MPQLNLLVAQYKGNLEILTPEDFDAAGAGDFDQEEENPASHKKDAEMLSPEDFDAVGAGDSGHEEENPASRQSGIDTPASRDAATESFGKEVGLKSLPMVPSHYGRPPLLSRAAGQSALAEQPTAALSPYRGPVNPNHHHFDLEHMAPISWMRADSSRDAVGDNNATEHREALPHLPQTQESMQMAPIFPLVETPLDIDWRAGATSIPQYRHPSDPHQPPHSVGLSPHLSGSVATSSETVWPIHSGFIAQAAELPSDKTREIKRKRAV